MIFMTRRTLVRTAALETGMMLVAPLLAAETKPLTGAELQKEAVSISKVLRCPVSPNLTLYDSESAIANELKGVIYEKLRAAEPASRSSTSWSPATASRSATSPT